MSKHEEDAVPRPKEKRSKSREPARNDQATERAARPQSAKARGTREAKTNRRDRSKHADDSHSRKRSDRRGKPRTTGDITTDESDETSRAFQHRTREDEQTIQRVQSGSKKLSGPPSRDSDEIWRPLLREFGANDSSKSPKLNKTRSAASVLSRPAALVVPSLITVGHARSESPDMSPLIELVHSDSSSEASPLVEIYENSTILDRADPLLREKPTVTANTQACTKSALSRKASKKEVGAKSIPQPEGINKANANAKPAAAARTIPLDESPEHERSLRFSSVDMSQLIFEDLARKDSELAYAEKEHN